MDEYYHNNQMQSLLKRLKQPKTLEELRLSEVFVTDLILKIISSFGTIKTSRINEITSIHWDILEDLIRKLEDDGFCSPVSGGFLFSSVEYTITKKGREKAKRIMEENPYIGTAPVSYKNYLEIMDEQMKDRYPIEIPEKIQIDAFEDVIGVEYAKESLIESCTIGKGIFAYGAPGTGKTFIISKMADLLPPLIIPKYIEFGGRVIHLYDQDFHKRCEEQPNDTRWIKIYAPFVFTGAELSLKELETVYNPNKGAYETSPLIKANGGILLLDDLGRQRDDHELILNRLIIPMENKNDVVYVRGVPITVHSNFIPAFSTNLDISIMDEAHLRRAPLHIFLKDPSVNEVAQVFKRNLDELGESYGEDVVKRFIQVYTPAMQGGEGLQPSFAHARDVAQIAQAARITKKMDVITKEILEEALNKHVLIVLQRMNIDVAQIAKKIRTFRINSTDLDKTVKSLNHLGALRISVESEAIVVDLEENITPAHLIEYLSENGITVEKVELIAITEKELRRTIFEEKYK